MGLFNFLFGRKKEKVVDVKKPQREPLFTPQRVSRSSSNSSPAPFHYSPPADTSYLYSGGAVSDWGSDSCSGSSDSGSSCGGSD